MQVLGLTGSLKQLLEARRDTIKKVQARKLSYNTGLLMQVLGLTGSLKQLVEARRDTIEKLRASADYLDSIWLRSVLSVIYY
jgi:hypothetical protein